MSWKLYFIPKKRCPEKTYLLKAVFYSKKRWSKTTYELEAVFHPKEEMAREPLSVGSCFSSQKRDCQSRLICWKLYFIPKKRWPENPYLLEAVLHPKEEMAKEDLSVSAWGNAESDFL